MSHYLKEELYALIKVEDDIFEFLQFGSLDGIWYWDLEKPENEWMSPEFWRTLGYDPNSKPHLAEAWQDLIFKEDLQAALKNFERHCENQSHPYDQVVRYRHFNGSTVWVRCRGLAIRDEHGKPLRMLGAHTNITQQKQLEKQLQEQLAKEEKRNQYLADFAATASHDLKAPLRRIASYLTLIESELERSASEDVLSMMTVVTENATFLQGIVDDLLELARLDNAVVESKQVDMNHAVQLALDNLALPLSDWPGEVEVRTLPILKGVENLLVLLTQNLVSNAIIYTQSDAPEIVITGGETEENWWLEIEDNGIGIEEKYFDKIFGVFQRLHNRREFEGGSGIGLTICHRIVELHKGTIMVRSTVGQGTTMRVVLPKL